jgi:hypothetical protein
LNPWEERGVGRGVLKVMEGEWQKMAEQGVNFQLNSLAEKTLRNTTTNQPFCHIAGWFVAKSWVEKTRQLAAQKSIQMLR